LLPRRSRPTPVSPRSIGIVPDAVVVKKPILPPRRMKYLDAIASEQICRCAEALIVAGQRYPLMRPALAFLADGVCTTLPSGMLLPIGTHPDSYDGRYFGPVPESQVRRVNAAID
jgi:type IV secretory pathway protease TraF